MQCKRGPWAAGLAALAVGLALSGCGGQGPVKVTGTLTLNGQPVEGAMVQFFPAKDGGRPATGTTQADGSFRLTTVENYDGAMPGEYKVVITYNPPVESAPGENTEHAMRAAMAAQAQQKKSRPKYVIPRIYTDPTQTPLTQTVPTNGPVKIDIK
jgi:hypothetical protein